MPHPHGLPRPAKPANLCPIDTVISRSAPAPCGSLPRIVGLVAALTQSLPFPDAAPFARLAPAGHLVALRFGLARAALSINALPPKWAARYAQRGYFVFDPVVRRLFAAPGRVRWSDVPAAEDPAGILAQAAGFGLKHGVGLSFRDEEGAGPVAAQISFGLFARADRPFADDEIDALAQAMEEAHVRLRPPAGVTRAEREALGMIRAGYLTKEIAAELGVTDGAIKQRLKNAKVKLGANTTAAAACLAADHGLI